MATAESIRTTTGALFVPTPGMAGLFESNFDFQLVRAMVGGGYGAGGAVGECFATARRIIDRDLESWSVAWSETAYRIEDAARGSLEGGHRISAREGFLRACTYWRTACFFLAHEDPRWHDWFDRHKTCFREAAALSDTPIEPVSIPYEGGKTLPGYFMQVDATGAPRPTVMIIGGADTTCEEMYFWGGGAAAVRRGYNALLWEGPGQLGAYALDPDLKYRPDWEVPTRYVVDYALNRSEVDSQRLALSGHSFGGYFAPRAAAFEKRLNAVMAHSLLPRVTRVFTGMLGLDPEPPYRDDVVWKEPGIELLFKNFMVRMGVSDGSVARLLEVSDGYRLDGLESEIECPLLNLANAGEGDVMVRLGHEFFEKLTCPKGERVIRGEEGGDLHCTTNNPSLKHQIEFDWLDEVFAT